MILLGIIATFVLPWLAMSVHDKTDRLYARKLDNARDDQWLEHHRVKT